MGQVYACYSEKRKGELVSQIDYIEINDSMYLKESINSGLKKEGSDPRHIKGIVHLPESQKYRVFFNRPDIDEGFDEI